MLGSGLGSGNRLTLNDAAKYENRLERMAILKAFAAGSLLNLLSYRTSREAAPSMPMRLGDQQRYAQQPPGAGGTGSHCGEGGGRGRPLEALTIRTDCGLRGQSVNWGDMPVSTSHNVGRPAVRAPRGLSSQVRSQQ